MFFLILRVRSAASRCAFSLLFATVVSLLSQNPLRTVLILYFSIKSLQRSLRFGSWSMCCCLWRFALSCLALRHVLFHKPFFSFCALPKQMFPNSQLYAKQNSCFFPESLMQHLIFFIIKTLIRYKNQTHLPKIIFNFRLLCVNVLLVFPRLKKLKCLSFNPF